MGDALREKFPGLEFEVLPLACPGYTGGQGLAWLKRDIAKLKPDVVLACFGWNDVRAAGLPDSATMPASGAQVFVRRLIGHSQLLLTIAESAQRHAPVATQPPQPDPRSSAAAYVPHFPDMETASRATGPVFGILLPCTPPPPPRGVVPSSAPFSFAGKVPVWLQPSGWPLARRAANRGSGVFAGIRGTSDSITSRTRNSSRTSTLYSRAIC